MIDIKTYIESGILEDYLAGQVSDQERREVECLSKIYPEIKTELAQLEEALEQLAFAQRVTPPLALKDKIMEQLVFADELPNVSEDQENIRPLYPHNPRKASFQWGWVAAASVLALIGLSFYFNSQVTTLRNQISAQGQLIEQQKGQLALLEDANNQFITLKGVEKSPESAVRVVWNPKTQTVQLNVLSLPTPTSEKQYQLWALVGGKPVDLGVFEVTNVTQKMKAIPQAEAFAVTLEQRGGSPTPTLTEMYVLGKVSS
ncbi:MAG: anti-sigma factor domain-containing protein [Runella sp.]